MILSQTGSVKQELFELSQKNCKINYQEAAARAGTTYNLERKTHDVVAETTGDAVTVTIRGPLDGGWFGVDVEDVIKKLGTASNITVIVDSPGGFITEGMTLYSELRARAKEGATIKTEGRALVASAAILPFLAGDERSVADGTLLMVHNPMVFTCIGGDLKEWRRESSKVDSVLAAWTSNYLETVALRTGRSEAAVEEEMDAETWYSKADAKTKGFIVALGTVNVAVSAQQRMAAGVFANLKG